MISAFRRKFLKTTVKFLGIFHQTNHNIFVLFLQLLIFLLDPTQKTLPLLYHNLTLISLLIMLKKSLDQFFRLPLIKTFITAYFSITILIFLKMLVFLTHLLTQKFVDKDIVEYLVVMRMKFLHLVDPFHLIQMSHILFGFF